MFSKIGMALIKGLSADSKVFWRYKGTATLGDGTEVTNGLFYNYLSGNNPLKHLNFEIQDDTNNRVFSGWGTNGILNTPFILLSQKDTEEPADNFDLNLDNVLYNNITPISTSSGSYIYGTSELNHETNTITVIQRQLYKASMDTPVKSLYLVTGYAGSSSSYKIWSVKYKDRDNEGMSTTTVNTTPEQRGMLFLAHQLLPQPFTMQAGKTYEFEMRLDFPNFIPPVQ